MPADGRDSDRAVDGKRDSRGGRFRKRQSRLGSESLGNGLVWLGVVPRRHGQLRAVAGALASGVNTGTQHLAVHSFMNARPLCLVPLVVCCSIALSQPHFGACRDSLILLPQTALLRPALPPSTPPTQPPLFAFPSPRIFPISFRGKNGPPRMALPLACRKRRAQGGSRRPSALAYPPPQLPRRSTRPVLQVPSIPASVRQRDSGRRLTLDR